MAFFPAPSKEDNSVINVYYTNASAVSIAAASAAGKSVQSGYIALTTSNTTDLSDYILVGMVDLTIGGTPSKNVGVCQFNLGGSNKNLVINNFTTDAVSLPAGYISVTLRYLHK